MSFRSAPRILDIFRNHQYYPSSWIPHFTSVINWVLRVGLARLKSIAHKTDPWAAIIDHSIDVGIKKALVILRVPLRLLSEKGKALELMDCQCIGLRISENTDYETISAQISEIFDASGNPTVIIKDQAKNLAKAVVNWQENKAGIKKPITVDDIGHFAANALKAEFEKIDYFRTSCNLFARGLLG